MMTNTTTLLRLDTAGASGLTQLTEDEIAAVGGGLGPLFYLVVFVGIMCLPAACN